MGVFKFVLLFFIGVVLISCGTDSSPTLFDVQVSVSPGEGGTVSPEDSTLEEGESLTLTAAPAEGYRFIDWSGDAEASENPLSLTVDQDYSLIANFEKKSYELTVNTEGGGTVDEQSLQTKTKEYEHGTVVELTANPAEGWRFIEWTGDVSSEENPLEVIVDQPKEMTAVFEKKSYELTVNTEGEGAVDEEIVQAKTTEYEHGTIVELTANPAEDWQFVEWEGDLSGSENPEQITVEEPEQVTAVFERQTYPLTINTEGEGAVNRAPDQSKYAFNTEVKLEAVPASGWSFVDWTGDISSTESTVRVTMDEAKQINAVFEVGKEGTDDRLYTLDVQLEGAGTFETKLLTGAKQDSGYTFGSKVRIFVTVADGHYFDRFEGSIDVNYDAPVFGRFKKNVVIKNDMMVIGVIKKIPFAGGSGTEENPYEVSSLDQLNAVRMFTYDNKDYFNQVADIDASATEDWNNGQGFRPITGKNVFYDGQGHTISNLTIKYDAPAYIGLFGDTYSGSEFRNLHLDNLYVNSTGKLGGDNARYTGGVAAKGDAYNINVTGTIIGVSNVGGILGTGTVKNSQADVEVSAERKNTGALVGQGNVFNSTATGKVSGTEAVGGLTGAGTVTNSSASINVTGESEVGGLAGYGRSTNSFATGNVSGGTELGGLIGKLSGKIVQSYATGSVSGTNNVGGLVGSAPDEYQADADIIHSSYALGKVSGTNNVGGLIGNADDVSIRNSYSYGDVKGEKNVGGLIGSLTEYKEVLYSFSTGKVSGTTNAGGFLGFATDLRDSGFNDNYWDISTAGQSEAIGNMDDVGVNGLTTNQMTGNAAKNNMSEFDFVEIWVTTDSYPILKWQK